MSKRIWHSGAPPFPGWWNASVFSDEGIWRWWDGKVWSDPCSDQKSSMFAGKIATTPDDPIARNTIQWTTYWPKGARVKRIKP